MTADTILVILLGLLAGLSIGGLLVAYGIV